jgi:iron complex transport system substrate-binding protein
VLTSDTERMRVGRHLTAISRRSRGLPAAVAALASIALVLSACSSSASESTAASNSAAASKSAASSESSIGAAGSESGSAARTEPGEPIVITAADLPAITALAAPTAQTPQRIVSLATGVGETLVALGVGDRVVGRDETSEVPSDAEVVTQAHNVSAERVISLAPDLVIVDARTTPPEALDQIEAAGTRIVEVPEAWTLSDMAPRTQAIADAVGVDAGPLLATLPSDAAPGTGDPTAAGPRVAFLYLRGTSAIYLLGGEGSGADALITAAGGVDAGAEAGLEAFTPLTAEALVALDPDVLLVMTGGLESVNGMEGLLALPGVAQTTAGRERRVVAVDDEVLLSYGPRTGALVELLRSAIGSAAPMS